MSNRSIISSPPPTLDQLLAAGYSLEEIAKKKDRSEKRQRQECSELADKKSATLKQLRTVRRASAPSIESMGARKELESDSELQRSGSLGAMGPGSSFGRTQNDNLTGIRLPYHNQGTHQHHHHHVTKNHNKVHPISSSPVKNAAYAKATAALPLIPKLSPPGKQKQSSNMGARCA